MTNIYSQANRKINVIVTQEGGLFGYVFNNFNKFHVLEVKDQLLKNINKEINGIHIVLLREAHSV